MAAAHLNIKCIMLYNTTLGGISNLLITCHQLMPLHSIIMFLGAHNINSMGWLSNYMLLKELIIWGVSCLNYYGYVAMPTMVIIMLIKNMFIWVCLSDPAITNGLLPAFILHFKHCKWRSLLHHGCTGTRQCNQYLEIQYLQGGFLCGIWVMYLREWLAVFSRIFLSHVLGMWWIIQLFN